MWIARRILPLLFLTALATDAPAGQPAPGLDELHAASRLRDARLERESDPGLLARSRRLTERYAAKLQQGGGFDWKPMVAMAAGGGLGFFLGSRFLGPKGGMIGAFAGALAAGAITQFLVDRAQQRKLEAGPEAATAPPPPLSIRQLAPPLPPVAQRPVFPASRAAMRERYLRLREAAANRAADAAARFQEYQQVWRPR